MAPLTLVYQSTRPANTNFQGAAHFPACLTDWEPDIERGIIEKRSREGRDEEGGGDVEKRERERN